MQHELVGLIIGKCEAIKKPSRSLMAFLASRPTELRVILRWLVLHEYDTFICREVIACLHRPVDAETEALALALQAVFSGCLSARPCRKAGASAAVAERVCSHVVKPCKGRHLRIGSQDEVHQFFRLLALLVDVGELPKAEAFTCEARGGGGLRQGEVSAMGVQTKIQDTYHNRGHQSDMIKKSKLNASLMFAVAKMVALSTNGKRKAVTAVCTHGKHRSRMVSSVSAIVLKTLWQDAGVQVDVLHNGK